MSFRLLILLISFFSLLLTGLSCERDAKIRPHHTTSLLVVEGKIESGKAPKVILTKSMSYFSAFDTSIFRNLFVHDAEVSVSTGNREIPLIEKEKDTLLGTKFYYYEPKKPNSFIGIPGLTYDLKIKTNKANYKATTSIPYFGFILDSIWWEPILKNGKPDSTKVTLMAKIYDPPQKGNYARYFTKRNEEPFFPGIISVAEDNITNGKLFDFQISKGVPKNAALDREDFAYFYRGDTVTIKFCNIDKTTYRFWSTWEYAWSNTGNPFATPTKVEGNIPGAMGYWGGYQTQFKRLIIPK